MRRLLRLLLVVVCLGVGSWAAPEPAQASSLAQPQPAGPAIAKHAAVSQPVAVRQKVALSKLHLAGAGIPDPAVHDPFMPAAPKPPLALVARSAATELRGSGMAATRRTLRATTNPTASSGDDANRVAAETGRAAATPTHYLHVHVVDGEGSSLDGTEVSVAAPDGAALYGGLTGNMAPPGTADILVADGSYIVWLGRGAHDFASGWYKSGGFAFNIADADIVTVHGADVSITVTMLATVVVTGHVSGLPMGFFAYVQAFVEGDLDVGMGSANTDSSGNYTIYLVPGHRYSFCYSSGQVSASNNPQAGCLGESGLVTSDVDAQLIEIDGPTTVDAAMPQPTHITGKVTDPEGTGIAGVDVYAYLPDGTSWKATTQPGGTYYLTLNRITPIESDFYILGFCGNDDFACVWYAETGSVVTSGDATVLEIPLGSPDVENINVALPRTRLISGTVRSGSTGVPYIFVEAYVDGVYYSYAATDSSGHYTIPVAPGDCVFWFYDSAEIYNGKYAGGWYDGSGLTLDWDLRSTVPVSTIDIAGIDVSLATARHIKGKVASSGGIGLDSALVNVYVNGHASAYAFTGTGSSLGSYSIPVTAGTYSLHEGGVEGVLPAGWRNGSGITSDIRAASPISVTTADVAANITVAADGLLLVNAQSVRGSTIAGAYVEAYTGGGFYDSVQVGGWGAPALAIPHGSYVIRLFDPRWLFARGFYSSGGFVYNSNEASSLSIGAKASVKFDFTLPRIDVPGAPVNVVAYPFHGSADVTWDPPASDGGSDIIRYTVTSNPDGLTCRSGVTGCTIDGLTDGTPYTFTVTATSRIGTGSASVPSSAVTPVPVPEAPGSVTGIGLDGAIKISWTAAADNGHAVTGYTAQVWGDGTKHCSPASLDDLTCTITGLTNHTPYWVTVYATNDQGNGPEGISDEQVTPRVGASYVPLTPTRVMDSKSGIGLTGALAPYVAASFQVSGSSSGVPATASAVTGILSVSDATYKGWVALTPEPDNAPTTSSINFPVNDARSTGVTVPLGSGGKLSVTYGSSVPTSSVQVIFDVTGYFVAGTGGATYVSLTPNRLVDSRPTGSGHTNTGLGAALVAGTPATFQVTGRTPSAAATNVPANAVAVTGTLTVTGQSAAGSFSLGPDPLPTPGYTSLFFPKGDNRATGLTIKLGTGGKLSVTFVSATAGATAHVIFDVNGYFAPGTSGAMYVPVTPNRLVDSRIKLGISGALRNHVAATFTVANRVPGEPAKNVPLGAVAITGTLTVTGQTYPGWLALTPTPNNNPTTSNLNFPHGDNRATGVTVPISTAGKCSVTYGATTGKTTHVVFDVSGYFVN